MSPEKLPPDPDRPANRAAERLAVIVDAAERAALSVIDDAEKEARRYLAEAQARADRIVAERLREAADQLDRLGGKSQEPRLRPVEHEEIEGARQAAEPSFEEDELPEPSDQGDRGAPQARGFPPTPSPGSARIGGAAAARLLATQMAVSGSSRKEIEMRLRSGFDIEDSGEILDAILGPEE